MSVPSIIGGGVNLVRSQPQTIAIWAAVYLVVMAGSMVLMRPWMAAMLLFQQQATANAAGGIDAMPALPTGVFGRLFLLELLFCVALVIAFAAVVRAVTRRVGDRFAYLRLGMDELRLIGLSLLMVVAAIVAETVAIFALILIAVLLAFVAGKVLTVALVAVFTIALLCGAIYVQVRLSLAGALTVMRGKIIIGDAWRATRGHFWTLFGAYALLTLLFATVMIVVVALTNLNMLAAYARLDPQAINAALLEQLAGQGAGLSAGTIVQLLIGAVVSVPMGAILCGTVATAALELGGSAPAGDEATGID